MDKNQTLDKPKVDRRGHRYSTSERKRILRELANSGLSSNAFCRQQGYCYPTVRRWINQDVVCKPKKSSPSFLEVAVHPATSDSKQPMVVELLSGHRIHIHNREHLAWAQVFMGSKKEKSC